MHSRCKQAYMAQGSKYAGRGLLSAHRGTATHPRIAGATQQIDAAETARWPPYGRYQTAR